VKDKKEAIGLNTAKYEILLHLQEIMKLLDKLKEKEV